MIRFKRALFAGILLTILLGSGWFVTGPRVLANISAMKYKEENYQFTVEMDEKQNEAGFFDEIGIIVVISPDLQPENASAFSDAYLSTSYARAENWVLKRNSDDQLDLLLVFSHPLTLDEANQVLKESNATVFESGVVGFAADGTPFANYLIEDGSYLTNRLDSPKFIQFSGITDEDENLESVKPADVRGYMSVRVWVNQIGLQALLDSELVQMVDTTPQAVRDQLATDRNWQDEPITVLAIEMPVWAYSWETNLR